MTIKVYPDKMAYLDQMIEELPKAKEPSEYTTNIRVALDWVEGNVGHCRLGDLDLHSDERAQSTGFGRAPSPAQYFLAGLGFSYFTQWGRASAVLGVPIDGLTQEVHGWFDRRGEYLYELGWPHMGFEEITLTVRIDSPASREQVREFIAWAERSPPHATMRRAVRLIGRFYLNGKHLTTAIYHPDRTEYRG